MTYLAGTPQTKRGPPTCGKHGRHHSNAPKVHSKLIRTNIYRYALNIKQLKYKTEWVEYPDIESLYKKLGAEHTATKADGVTPHYTLPLLHDLSTGTLISDSVAIVQYLDEKHPDTPTLLPSGTRGLHSAFLHGFRQLIPPSFSGVFVVPSYTNLTDGSRPYFRRTREASLGKKLEDVTPEGEAYEAHFKELEAVLKKVAGWYDANGEGPFIGGKDICFADVIIAARFIWIKILMGKDSEHWTRICALDGGRWARFAAEFEKYETVV